MEGEERKFLKDEIVNVIVFKENVTAFRISLRVTR